MKFRLALTPLLVALAATDFAPLAWPQIRPRPAVSLTQIRGQVRYAHGPAAPQGIMIILESEKGGVVAQSQTDSQGKFIFSQLAQGIYTVKVNHPGYRELSERVNLSTSPTAYLVLDLQPIPGEAPRVLPPEGPHSLVSIGVLAVPEDAQREFEEGNRLLMDRKDPRASVPHFLKAIQRHPQFARAHLLLGTAYMDQNKWKDAQPAFEKAIQLDDKLGPAHLAMGACFNQQGNFAGAEKALLRGLELNPDSAQGHYELGRAYWALGRWPEAEPHARKAAELAPDLAPVHVLMGNILLRKRDARAALEEFKEYLRREPQGPLAAPTREMVAKIEKALASSQ